MKKNGKELAVKNEGVLIDPSKPRRGFETESGREDLLIPRVKLLQPLSPEVDELNMKAGQLINSLTKEVLPHEFIPVFVFKEYLRFNPRDEKSEGFDDKFAPGALMWKTSDPHAPEVEQTKFGPNGERPLGQQVLNFFSFFPGCDMPIIVSFAKTSYKAGKQLYSLTKFCQGDMFSRKYTLTAKKETNDAGTFWVLQVAPAGLATPEQFKAAEALWSSFSSKAASLNTHELEPETV